MALYAPAHPSLLLRLPEEVLAHISTFVDDTSILPLSLTSRKLYRIATSPLGMRERCLTRWTHWHARHEIQKKRTHRRAGDIDWKRLFLERYNADLATLGYLNRIINTPLHHIELFNRIVDYGNDALDVLAEQAAVGDEVEDKLARQWHATDAIRYIHRRNALSIFRSLRWSSTPVPLETALGALELFSLSAPTPAIPDTSALLDTMAATFLSLHPTFSELPPADAAPLLIRHLWSLGYTGAPASRYRALKNTHLGLTLRTVHSAIPLTLVAIFTAIAARCSLTVHPVAFPGMIYARVDTTTGPLFYDLYTTIPSTGGLVPESVLHAHATMSGENLARTHRRPARTQDLVIRMAQNIIATLQLPQVSRLVASDGYPPVDEGAALYAALTALVVLKGEWVSGNVVSHLTQQIPGTWPMDVRFLEEELLPRIQNPIEQRSLRNVCGALRAEDSAERAVTKRAVGADPKWGVGSVVRHRRHGYVGAVFGWTAAAVAEEGAEGEWEGRGGKRPFYHVLVSDGTVRYVAEESIVECVIEGQELGDLVREGGRYFRRFDNGRARFVSNVRWEFPDD